MRRATTHVRRPLAEDVGGAAKALNVEPLNVEAASNALDAIAKAKAKIASAAGKPWADVIDDDVTATSSEISSKIDELGHLSFSEADAKKVAEIEAALAELTTAASDLDSLCGVLPKLELARDGLSQRLTPLPQTDPPHTDAPPLAAKAKQLLAPATLTLAGLNALVHKKVPDMLTLIADWKSRDDHVADAAGGYDEMAAA